MILSEEQKGEIYHGYSFCVFSNILVVNLRVSFLVVKEHIANIGIPLDIFGFLPFLKVFAIRIVFEFLGLCKPGFCA